MPKNNFKDGAHQSKKILFLIDELNVGGTEKQLVWLCNELSRHQFFPTIGVLRKFSGRTPLRIDVPVVNFNWCGFPVIKNFSLILRLRKYLKKNNVDILQTQFVESEIYGLLAALSLQKKPLLISTRRNMYHWIQDDPWRFRIGKFLSGFADHVLVNSYAVQKRCRALESIRSDKITVIQNAVNYAEFARLDVNSSKMKLGLEPTDYVVGLVGNWRKVKGADVFLEAAKIIAEKITDARFVLAGQGPLELELQELARKYGIANRALFIKNPTNVPLIIASMDVAIQSSWSESFSNVLLEYMAAGKPIVATNVGDAFLMLAGGKNGLLVSAGDSEKMAEAVVELYKNLDSTKRMARQAQEVAAKKWKDEVVFSQYVSFYNTLLQGRLAE